MVRMRETHGKIAQLQGFAEKSGNAKGN